MYSPPLGRLKYAGKEDLELMVMSSIINPVDICNLPGLVLRRQICAVDRSNLF
jgi:hypothetical protein